MVGERGFTYVFLLFVVALGGVLLATAGQLWWMNARRDKEDELLYAGRQIRLAIESYYRAAPQSQPAEGGQPAGMTGGEYPRSLDDLLEDRRHSPPRRHLRKVFVDPVTGSREWGLIVEAEHIVGVHSRSGDKPLRTHGFAPGEDGFGEAASYRAWLFRASPAATPAGNPPSGWQGNSP